MNSGYFYAPYVPLTESPMIRMTTLERERSQWYEAGLTTAVVQAPKDAVTFDKMLVVYADDNMKMIRQVNLYNSKEDRFVGQY